MKLLYAVENEGWYGNFDIILDRVSRIVQLHLTPHALCACVLCSTW